MKDLPVEQKRCLELARVIRDGSSGLGFDMRTYVDYCGTVGCIGGHAVFLYNREVWNAAASGRLELDFLREGAQLLGLSIDEACALFHDYSHTPETAAAALEALAMEKVDA